MYNNYMSLFGVKHPQQFHIIVCVLFYVFWGAMLPSSDNYMATLLKIHDSFRFKWDPLKFVLHIGPCHGVESDLLWLSLPHIVFSIQSFDVSVFDGREYSHWIWAEILCTRYVKLYCELEYVVWTFIIFTFVLCQVGNSPCAQGGTRIHTYSRVLMPDRPFHISWGWCLYIYIYNI